MFRKVCGGGCRTKQFAATFVRRRRRRRRRVVAILVYTLALISLLARIQSCRAFALDLRAIVNKKIRINNLVGGTKKKTTLLLSFHNNNGNTTKTASSYSPSVQGEDGSLSSNLKPVAAATTKEEDIELTRQVIAQYLNNKEKLEREQHHSVLAETLGNVSSAALKDIRKVTSDSISSTAEKTKSLLDMPVIRVIMGLLVVLNSFAVAIDTLPKLPFVAKQILDILQYAIMYLFSIEFVARWYSSNCESNWRYFSRPLVMVDIVVVIVPLLLSWLGPSSVIRSFLPRWLNTAEGLQNLRLLRIVRLQRSLEDKETLSRDLMALGLPAYEVRPYRLQLAKAFLTLFTLLSVSSGLVFAFEHTVNPQITNYFGAMYFTLCTLTTVGFGDIVPISVEGRLVVSLSILAGVLLIPYEATLAIEALLQQDKSSTETKTKETSPSGAVSSISSFKSSKTNKSRMEENPSILAREETSLTISVGDECAICGAIIHTTQARYCWSCRAKLW